MKKQSISKLKKKLWKIFSEYIRLKYSDPDGFCECYTCENKFHWKKLQCGHLLDGRSNGILFEEENVRPQCLGCNIFKHGNKEEYYPKMLKEIGEDRINELKKLKRMIFKLDVEWYENKIKWYSDLACQEKLRLKMF